jgi:hypothetical protein
MIATFFFLIKHFSNENDRQFSLQRKIPYKTKISYLSLVTT